MKVFLIIRYLDYSGAPKMFLWVARSLTERGYDVTICTLNTSSDIKVPPNLKWIDLTQDNLGFWGKIRKLRKIIRQGEYDVSISFLLDGNVYNTLICYGLKTKSVICERNDPFKPHYYKLKFWKPWFRLADGAVFQLPKVADFYSNIRGPIAVIPNPIMPPSVIVETPFVERENVIITMGRMDLVQKRQDVLIKAFSEFVKDYPSYKLMIYGGSDIEGSEKKIKRLIEELKVNDSVTLAGVTRNAAETMKKAKIFVLTSDFEGIPNSLIEAMSIGMPCLSTDCRPGGAKLLIDNGKNGLLVPTGDIGQLTENMRWMVEHPLECDKMGKEARKVVEYFSEKITTAKWENYLWKLKVSN